MKKILKIIAMLLVVAAVVSAAGCAGKKQTTSNVTPGATEKVTPEATPATIHVVTPATSVVTPAVINEATGNASGNNTSSVISATPTQKIEQTTGNATVATGVNKNSVERHKAIASSQQQSSSTQNVSVNGSK